MTAPRHVDVGAYVLGILDEPDEAAYEEHFAQCEQCRREFIEMADLPAILDTMKPAKAESQRAEAGPEPALPPLDSLIDFRALAAAGQTPPGPAVPPQLRPSGATQPQRVPPAPPTNGHRVNGHPGTGTRHTPVTRPPAQPSRAEGTGRSTPVSRPGEHTGHSAPVSRPGEHTGRSAPVARPGEHTGHSTPASRPGEHTGRSAPVSRPAESTGRSTPASRPSENTGRSAPASRPGENTGRSAPASRVAGSTRPATAKPPTKPPSKAPSAGQAAGPRGRRRKPVWLAAAAVVAVALSVGVVIGVTSGDSGGGQQVADPGTSAPAPSTSGAVAGAHVVSGTDPKSGATAIITIEPVAEGTQIDVALYEVAAPAQGEVFVVSRFGDREQVATWKADAGSVSIRTTGVSALPQHDISRFEIHGGGTEPLLVVPV